LVGLRISGCLGWYNIDFPAIASFRALGLVFAGNLGFGFWYFREFVVLGLRFAGCDVF